MKKHFFRSREVARFHPGEVDSRWNILAVAVLAVPDRHVFSRSSTSVHEGGELSSGRVEGDYAGEAWDLVGSTNDRM